MSLSDASAPKIAVVHTTHWNRRPIETISLYIQDTQESHPQQARREPEYLPYSSETLSSDSDITACLLGKECEDWRTQLLEYLFTTKEERAYLLDRTGERKEAKKGPKLRHQKLHSSDEQRYLARISQLLSRPLSKEEFCEFENSVWRSYDQFYL